MTDEELNKLQKTIELKELNGIECDEETIRFIGEVFTRASQHPSTKKQYVDRFIDKLEELNIPREEICRREAIFLKNTLDHCNSIPYEDLTHDEWRTLYVITDNLSADLFLLTRKTDVDMKIDVDEYKETYLSAEGDKKEKWNEIRIQLNRTVNEFVIPALNENPLDMDKCTREAIFLLAHSSILLYVNK